MHIQIEDTGGKKLIMTIDGGEKIGFSIGRTMLFINGKPEYNISSKHKEEHIEMVIDTLTDGKRDNFNIKRDITPEDVTYKDIPELSRRKFKCQKTASELVEFITID